MSTPELLCPQTQQPCRFIDDCLLKKGLVERDPSEVLSPGLQALLDSVTQVIPAPLLEAQRSSWCSEEQVRAIGIAAFTELQKPELDSADGDSIKRWTAILVAGTLTDRQKEF